MKKAILIILMNSLIFSCTSAQNIDLADIKMPYSSEKLLNKNYDFKKEEVGYFVNIQRHTSFNEDLLNFNGISLAGKLTSSNDNFLNKNYIEIQVDEEQKTIPYFRLKIFTTKQSNTLYKNLLKKLGKPLYYEKNEEVFNGAWEKGNITYLFSLNYKSSINNTATRISDLYIIDNSINKLTDRYYSGNFQYFGDFVKERKKRNNPNYTYEEFAKYKSEEDWVEYYLDKIKNNKPL